MAFICYHDSSALHSLVVASLLSSASFPSAPLHSASLCSPLLCLAVPPLCCILPTIGCAIHAYRLQLHLCYRVKRPLSSLHHTVHTRLLLLLLPPRGGRQTMALVLALNPAPLQRATHLQIMNA
jgi:hypothetical protein